MTGGSIKPNVRIEIFRKGKLAEVIVGHNLMTQAGANQLAAIIGGSSTDLFDYMACGDGTTAVSVGQTALQGNEHKRVAGTAVVVDNAATWSATFSGFSSTVTINEIGIFTAASGGIMLARFLTSQFTIGAGESFDVSWSITVGEGN